jgi:hypothetical protein
MQRRFLIATDLFLRFLSRPKVLTISVVPLIFWPLKRIFYHRTSLSRDLVILLIVYALAAVGIFLWKFIQAADVIAHEPGLRAELDKLDAPEQNELRRLIRSGKLSVGPPIFDRIAAKTNFIYRDVSGEWRVEREYRKFLKDWEKSSRPG